MTSAVSEKGMRTPRSKFYSVNRNVGSKGGKQVAVIRSTNITELASIDVSNNIILGMSI